MWLDGSMLTEDVFSLDALMLDSMPVLMPSSMLARCWLDAWLDGDAWLNAGSMQARDASRPLAGAPAQVCNCKCINSHYAH